MRTRADRSRRRFPVGVLGLLAVAAGAAVPPALHAQVPHEFVPVTDAMLQAPSDDDWLMWRRTLDGWGF